MKAVKRIVSVMLIALMLCGGAMAASYKANVITSSMEVYNSKKEYIGTLPRGTGFTVKAISKNGNWAKIDYKGHVGFASMKNILFKNVIESVCTKTTSMTFVTKSSFKEGEAYKAKVGMGTLVNVVGYYDGYVLLESDSGNALGVAKASCFKKIRVSNKTNSQKVETEAAPAPEGFVDEH